MKKEQSTPKLDRLEAVLKVANEGHVTPQELKEFFSAVTMVIKDLKNSLANSTKVGDEALSNKIIQSNKNTIQTLQNYVTELKTIIASQNKSIEQRHAKIEDKIEKVKSKIPEMPVIPDVTNITRMISLHEKIISSLPKRIVAREEFDEQHESVMEILKKLPPYDHAPMMHTPSIFNLPDVQIVGITENQTIVWNGISFVPGNSSGGGSGGFGLEDLSSQVSSGNRVFVAKNTPSFVILNQQTYFQNYGYTLSGKTITFDASITPVSGSTVMSVYANQSSSGSGTLYNDTVSGVIDGVNKTFTVPNIIGSAINLVLANSSYQFGVDYTFSNNTITMTTAPDLSLENEPFWFAYSSSTAILTETVSGTINGSNVTFTVPTTIINAIQLVLGNSLYQYGIDYSFSGNTITMTTAPDLSLRNQSFWLVHT